MGYHILINIYTSIYWRSKSVAEYHYNLQKKKTQKNSKQKLLKTYLKKIKHHIFDLFLAYSVDFTQNDSEKELVILTLQNAYYPL